MRVKLGHVGPMCSIPGTHTNTHTQREGHPLANTHSHTHPEGHTHSLRGTPHIHSLKGTHTPTHPLRGTHPCPDRACPAPSGPGPHTPSAGSPHASPLAVGVEAPPGPEEGGGVQAPVGAALHGAAADPGPCPPSLSGTACAPAPPPGPAFRAAAPPRGRPHGGRRGKSPPSRGSSHRAAPILLGCAQPQVVAGRGSAVEARARSPRFGGAEQCAARKHLESFKPPERREKCWREASTRLQSSGV